MHLHDGRSLLIPVKDPKVSPKEKYNSGDTLLITLPKQTIQSHVPLKKGVTVIITGGDHNGFVGKLAKIDLENKLGTIKGADKTTILTAIRYVFPIGKDDLLISLPKAG